MELMEGRPVFKVRGKRARVGVYKVGKIYLVEAALCGSYAYELDFFTRKDEAVRRAKLKSE